MYNRYIQLDRQPKGQAHESKTRKRQERHRRYNEELATKATKRVEEWMARTLDNPTAMQDASGANAFHYTFRSREKSKELTHGPGEHQISPNKYVPERQRIADTQELMAKSLREAREPYTAVLHGVSPFRGRDRAAELHPPIRFKDNTDAERVATTMRNLVPAWTDTGDDPCRVPQMGFDDIPAGMPKNGVCVRSRAKAPAALKFKAYFSNRALNGDAAGNRWEPDPFIATTEPSGYGMLLSNDPRQRKRSKEVSKSLFLSAVPSAGGLAPLGETTSHRKDRKEPVSARGHEDKSYYGASRNIVTMSGTFREGKSEVAATKQLATQILTGREKSRELTLKGANVYGWNELFGFKDHVLT